MDRDYKRARMVLTEANKKRKIPVIQLAEQNISGFHQGGGETVMTELLQVPFKQTSLVLIDEIESSLHPKPQRRLIRELADQCRQLDIQIILTTHSPYILSELPPEARILIMNEPSGRRIITGVSPEFAMTKMDEKPHPECDLYVEDDRTADLLREILIAHRHEIALRCQVITYGAASVGYALGQMVAERRFSRPACVFIDGDQEARPGCIRLPGDEAPERVIFNALRQENWVNIHELISRGFADVADACSSAMNYNDHHEWLRLAGDKLLVSTKILWHVMCVAWVKKFYPREKAEPIIGPIEAALTSPFVTAPTNSGRFFGDQGTLFS